MSYFKIVQKSTYINSIKHSIADFWQIDKFWQISRNCNIYESLSNAKLRLEYDFNWNLSSWRKLLSFGYISNVSKSKDVCHMILVWHTLKLCWLRPVLKFNHIKCQYCRIYIKDFRNFKEGAKVPPYLSSPLKVHFEYIFKKLNWNSFESWLENK